MCLGETLVTLPTQPYNGHHKASAREAHQRTPSDEQYRERLRPQTTPWVPSGSWPRTDRS